MKKDYIVEYLESSRRKTVFDAELEVIVRDESGSFTFDGYFVEYKDSSSTYEDGYEKMQWIIEVSSTSDASFWQVVGCKSSYDGNDFSDYWYDFKKVTPKTKEIVVWE